MAIIYQALSINKRNEVRLCECTHKPGFNFAVTVNGSIKGYATHIGDAYRLYNELAR